MRLNRFIKCLAAVCMVFLLVAGTPLPALAYFDQGDVSVSLGESSLSLDEGDSREVSVKVSPSSSDQLLGCGMAECPQICGEKNCLDENGQCTCAGTTYKTYYTEVSVSSSNTSVTSVSYSSGSLHVKAIGSGTAKITVTGSLRQYTDGSASLSVTVKEKATTAAKSDTNTSAGSSSSESSKSSGTTAAKKSTTTESTTKKSTKKKKKKSSSKTTTAAGTETEQETTTEAVTAEAVTEEEAMTTEEQTDGTSEKSKKKQKAAESSTETASGQWQTVDSDKGTIYFADIPDTAVGGDLLSYIAGTEAYADFRKTDETGNVYYSWEFYGMDITEARDMDMNISVTEDGTDEINALAGNQDILCLQFAEQEEFPGNADIYVQAGSQFAEGDTLYLYRYNEGEQTAFAQGDALTVTNGYVHQVLNEGGTYFLVKNPLQETSVNQESSAEMSDNSSVMLSAIPVLCFVVILVVIVAVVFLFIRKRRR